MTNVQHSQHEIFRDQYTWKDVSHCACESALCGHPLCWEANRRRMREFNRMVAMQIRNENQMKYPGNIPDNLMKVQSSNEDLEEDIFDIDFPTLSTVNLTDSFKVKSTTSSTSSRSLRNPRDKSVVLVGKLNLNNLASHSTDHMTLAPANTPLHSMAGYSRDVHSQASETLSEKSRTIYRETKDKYYKKRTKPIVPKVSTFNLNVPNVRKTPNKVLVWKPSKDVQKKTLKSEKSKESLSTNEGKSATVTLSMENIHLNQSKSAHALKARKPKTSPRMPRKKLHDGVPYTTPRESFERGTQTMETMATNEEIAVLRTVPMDVLIRVLEQAEGKGVLQPRHTQILLKQVRADDARPATQKDAIVYAEMPAGLESKNIKILDSPKVRSPRVPMETPMTAYKLDTTVQTNTQRGLYTAPVGSTADARNVRTLHAPMTADEQLRAKISQQNIENFQQQFPVSHEKPLKQIATIFNDETTSRNVKPFKYPREQRDIFLGPLLQDLPRSPETEFDSNYDAEVGGSTVLANPPSHVPSSDEHRTLSPPYRSSDTRSKTTTDNAGRPSRQTSPYGSNIDGWPQIQEDDYLIASSTIRNEPSPELGFLDNETEASIKSEVKSLMSEEQTMASGQFPNLPSTETQSPAPPPPSPEIPSSHATESTPASRGMSKLARDEMISSGKKSIVSEDTTPSTPPDSPEKTTLKSLEE